MTSRWTPAGTSDSLRAQRLGVEVLGQPRDPAVTQLGDGHEREVKPLLAVGQARGEVALDDGAVALWKDVRSVMTRSAIAAIAGRLPSMMVWRPRSGPSLSGSR